MASKRMNGLTRARTMDEAQRARLSDWLGGIFKVSVRIDTVDHRNETGATRQSWLVSATVDDKPSQYLLRHDAPTFVFESQDRANERVILELVRSRGVSVPKLIASCTDQTVFGTPFTLFEMAANAVTCGQQIVNDVLLGGDRRALTNQLGRELARIHRIEPSNTRLSSCVPPNSSPSAAQISNLRRRSRSAVPWPTDN